MVKKLAMLALLFPSLLMGQMVMTGHNRKVWGSPVVTYVTGNGAVANAVTLTGGSAGGLIVCSAHWSSTNPGSTATMSDGTNSLTLLSTTHLNNTLNYFGDVFYTLSATSGSKTYTVTATNSPAAIEVACMDFHTSSGSWHLDSSNSASAYSASSDSGAITTTGSAEVVVLTGKLSDVAATTSNPLINGQTPAEPSWSPVATYDHYYYKLFTAPFTAGHGTRTYSGATNWNAEISAFYAQ